MADIYLFNPSTEIALAADSPSFTPTKAVRKFERELCLLPALYAPAGSAILLPPGLTADECEALPYFQTASERGFTLVTADHIPAGSRLIPWGWNRAVAHYARRKGFSTESIPSCEYISELRACANRALTLKLWQEIVKSPDFAGSPLPMQLMDAKSLDIVLTGLGGDCIGKAPWSSSGRGVFPLTLPLPQIGRKRVADTIAKYGSIMVEPRWNKVLDFASEWVYAAGELTFLGYSVFESSESGRYSGNLVASQAELLSKISAASCPGLPEKAVEAQRDAIFSALQKLMQLHDNQPNLPPLHFGIDMLTDANGAINPCVELNLRRTMGHVAIDLYQLTEQTFTFTPGSPLSF